MSEPFDLVIHNTRIIDGTGNLSYKSDVGISDGKITRVEPNINPIAAKHAIDAAGLTTCPGFIDTHTHDDFLVLLRPTADEKILQGVTSLVTGNCGFSLAPLVKDKETFVRGLLGFVGGTEAADDLLEINSFNDYLSKVEAAKPGINVIPLVGHVNMRFALLGMENRAPNPAELTSMKDLAADAMREGAFGLSTGLIYPPANFADTQEIIELAKVAARFGGIYTTHLRSESDNLLTALAEAIKIGEEAALAVHISHHKAAGRNNWGKCVDSLKMMAATRARGIQITCDQYPYKAGSTYLGSVLPPRYLAEGPEELGLKLRDPTVRKEIAAEIEAGHDGTWENFILGAGFDNILIATAPNHPEYLGRSIADIARSNKQSEYDTLFDILAEEKMTASMVIFLLRDEDIARIIKSPYTMIGTDGIPGFGITKPHPRLTGTFPRILGEFVRQKGILSLEEAVRKMTSLPAQTFGVKQKGLLLEGFDADLVIFDPETIIDQSTYAEPEKKPLGIKYVLVNGEIAVKDGRVTGATSGQVLRHG